MTQQTLFYRKIVYVVLIAILLFPLYQLGSPSQKQSDGQFSSGGKLAQKRTEAGLAEANLGKIDPTGSAMKLATFGMRGVAISLLWNRSLEYEKRADWDNVVATANQIITLEPHFITIWDFVGWKLAYNASAMFDDYRERYRWVIRGFEFVQDGTVYNSNAPKLYVRAGWTISQKIGIADEKKQYRRLFREDDELAARQQEREIFVTNRDNWLLGHAFYKQAEVLYEDRHGDIGKETRLLFFGRAPLNRIRYAEWMSIDGCGVNGDNEPVFDEEHCATAWKMAEADWEAYSNKVVETTIEDKANPGKYRSTSLNLQKDYAKQIKDLEDKLISYLPEGVTRETIVWDRWQNELDDKQRAALLEQVRHPFDENDYNLGEAGFPARTIRAYLDGKYGAQPGWETDWYKQLSELRLSFIDEELRPVVERPTLLLSESQSKDRTDALANFNSWIDRATQLIRITPEVLAANVVPEKQAEAKDICAEIEKIKLEESFSRMFRDIMGANYHEREVVFEQTPEAREAHQHRHAVKVCYDAGQASEANKEFLACFSSWLALLNRPDFADLRYTPQIQTDLLEEIGKYVLVLEQLDVLYPKDYPLQEMVRFDQSVEDTIYKGQDALAYIEKEFADGKYKDSADDAEILMKCCDNFNGSDPMYGLSPLPELTDLYFQAVQNWIKGWESASADEFALARQTGKFSDYPGKTYLEFNVQKGDDNYQEIGKLEIERMNDSAKSFENLEKEIALWAKVVERAPVLKYDEASEIYGRIQNTVQEYLLELKKQDRPVPEDFQLKTFEKSDSSAI